MDDTQGAFVKGRQIMDCILIATECVEGLKKEKKSGLVCKIDMEKAYGRVDWDFLRWVLTKRALSLDGLNELWDVWITLTFLSC